MEIESIVINACITIFSLGLLIVSLMSYRRYKNAKLLFVGIVFFVFFVKGIFFSLSLFNEQLAALSSNPYVGLFDLTILILLFMTTLKR